ncbi:DUF1566 domain-containing protein [bacterium]|nr:DUF1566 domain-containing protein [bacterium]
MKAFLLSRTVYLTCCFLFFGFGLMPTGQASPVALTQISPDSTPDEGQVASAEQKPAGLTTAELDEQKRIALKWQKTLMAHTLKDYNIFIAEFKENALAANEIAKARTLVESLKGEKQASGTETGAARFLDLGDQTIMDRQSGLMWTKVDSYADLGRCLDFPASADYVMKLKTGGYNDWQIPSLEDIQTLYNKEYFSSAFDRRSIHVPSVFREGGAWWYWTRTDSEKGMPTVKDFVHGDTGQMDPTYCEGGGIRAVRFSGLTQEIVTTPDNP